MAGKRPRERSFYQEDVGQPSGRICPSARHINRVREVNRSVLVEFAPEQMFSLVDAVEDYPEFLPWCGGTTLRRRDQDVTRATILINFHGVRQSFTTENLKRAPHEMLIRLIDGPFRSLDGSWRFVDLGGRGCKVELALRYEFSGRLLERLVGPVFQHIADTLVDAFVKRAAQVYPREGGVQNS
jgi:ribosome-associated toxin RatA of RatAB toxin-antitoxin module